jgi:DNA primase large subunit
MGQSQRKAPRDDTRREEAQDREREMEVRGRGTDLRASPMMAHLLDALERGTDIGHYGRLTFVMVARFFMNEDEIVGLLAKQPDHDEAASRALVRQVTERDYNPPKRERILDWQTRQDFPICPDVDDPAACNVYRDLQFPDRIYDHIQEFYEEQTEARQGGGAPAS